MISENKQKYTKQILICGVVVNLVLNSIGIPTIGMKWCGCRNVGYRNHMLFDCTAVL